MKVYAFDVDEMLEVSGGPVRLADLLALRQAGHVVGICGNWAVFARRVRGWHHLISFLSVGDKAEFLRQLALYIPDVEEHVMVGNILGVSGASDDRGAAERAGWRFIREADFAAGAR